MLTWLIEVRPNALSVAQRWDFRVGESCCKALSASLLLCCRHDLCWPSGFWAKVWYLGGQHQLEGRCSDLCSPSIRHAPKDWAKAGFVLNNFWPPIQSSQVRIFFCLTGRPWQEIGLHKVFQQPLKLSHLLEASVSPHWLQREPRKVIFPSCGRSLWAVQMATQTELLWFSPRGKDHKGRKRHVWLGRKQEGKAREIGKLKGEKGKKWKEMKMSGKRESNRRREITKRLRGEKCLRDQAEGSQKQTSEKPEHHVEKPSSPDPDKGAAAAGVTGSATPGAGGTPAWRTLRLALSGPLHPQPPLPFLLTAEI